MLSSLANYNAQIENETENKTHLIKKLLLYDVKLSHKGIHQFLIPEVYDQ